MAHCSGACVVESLDPAHCGACGATCTSSQVCSLGKCVPRTNTVLVSGITGGVAIALDASYAYFVDSAGVHAVPRAGGAVVNIADATGTPMGVAVDATYAYWSENTGGAILRAPKDGSGTPSVVAAATQPQGLVIVGGTVYFASNLSGDQSIHAAPAAGGTASVFATLSDGNHFPGSLLQIVANGSNLYVANDQAAYEVPIEADGGAGTPVAVNTIGVSMTAGLIGARSNDFCGFWSGLSGRGLLCEHGEHDLALGELASSITLPECGLVYAAAVSPSGPTHTFLVPDPVLTANGATAQTLTPDDATVLVTDGTSIFFLNSAGELRVLPLP
jgi:hypothetical protein